MDKDETLDLASKLEEAFKGSEKGIAMSAIIQGDSVGFPLRIADPDESNLEGEPSGFDEAYDFAKSILDVGEVSTSKEGGYVWFEPKTQ